MPTENQPDINGSLFSMNNDGKWAPLLNIKMVEPSTDIIASPDRYEPAFTTLLSSCSVELKPIPAWKINLLCGWPRHNCRRVRHRLRLREWKKRCKRYEAHAG